MPRRTWSDEQLRDAVATSGTWTEVCRQLGLAPSGGGRTAVQRRAHVLGLAVDHLPRPGGRPPTRWSDDDLRRAVAAATSLADVFRQLGLAVGGGAWQRMREHIARLELDTSHFARPLEGRSEPAATDWTDDDLRAAVDGARSVSEVLRRLGFSSNAHGERRRVERRLTELGVPTDHLRGRAWARGRTAPRPRRSLDELLVAGRELGSTSALRERLIEEGVLERRCAGCGLDTWLGQPIPLQLDHIDGDRTDNRLENLRLLCPNCHARTDTYCGRNIGRR